MPTPKLRFKDENGQDFPEWIKVPFTNIADVRDGTMYVKRDLDKKSKKTCSLMKNK